MTWEGVPWFIAGGAEHSAEVSRVLAYTAVGGQEGVASSGDCKVSASAVPDGNVHIAPGAVSVLNRFAGGGQQAYLCRNVGDEVVALDPQGSSGPRYDLVAVVVEDHQYAGQPAPASVANGPYLRTKIYKNVPANTSNLYAVDPNQSGYALARVKFDASDGTINPADITDLRQMIVERKKRDIFSVKPNPRQALTSGAFVEWPTAPTPMQVNVPAWATRCVMVVHLSQVVYFGPAATGYFRLNFGGQYSPNIGWDLDTAAGGAERQTITLSNEFVVPSAMRGTTITVKTEGTGTAAGHWDTWDGPNMTVDLEFTEAPA